MSILGPDFTSIPQIPKREVEVFTLLNPGQPSLVLTYFPAQPLSHLLQILRDSFTLSPWTHLSYSSDSLSGAFLS